MPFAATRSESRRSGFHLPWKRLRWIGVIAGAGLILRAILDAQVFAKIMILGSMTGTGISIVLMLQHFRDERPFEKLQQCFTALTPLITLAFYLVLYRGQAKPYLLAMAALGLIGLGFGSAWSRATRMHLKDGQVCGRNSGWWLIFWALSFMMTQGLALAGRTTGLNLSLVIMALTSGIAVGTASGLLRSIGQALREAPAAITAALTGIAAFCEQCGERLAPGAAFCESCGARSPMAGFCEECGRALTPGESFCEQCGKGATHA